MALETTLTADDQAAFDAMRAADHTPAPSLADEGPAVEVVVDDAPSAAPQQEQSRTVPLSTLLEERESRKALQSRLDEQERRFEERVNFLLQRIAPQQPQAQQPAAAQQPPDPNHDPIGALQALNQQVERLRGMQAQTEQQQRQAQAAQQIVAAASAREAEFMAVTPDYADAVNHLKASRATELAALGVQPHDIQQIITVESIQVAAQALQARRNPAEVIYAMAKTRGYTGRPPAAAAAPAAQEQIERVAAGQRAGASLGTAAGAAPTPLTARALATMSDEEFARVAGKLTAAQERALFGA